MAEVMGAEAMESRICTDALDDEGYVLGYPGSAGKVAKALAGGKVYGIAYKSTKNPVTGTAEANKAVAIIRAPKIAKVQVQNGATNIAIGDILSMKGAGASGKATRHASTAWPASYASADAETISDENSMIVGIALEALAANTSGKIQVLLLCPLPIKQ